MPEVVWCHYSIIVNYDFIMQHFLTETKKKYEKDLQVLGFINPVVVSDSMKTTIFLNHKEIFLVVLILLSLVCKMRWKSIQTCIHVQCFFPEFLKYWKLTHIKKSVFSTAAKLNCCKLYYFGQTLKLKCRKKFMP